MPGSSLTNYLQRACLAAFIGCGAWFSWQDISHAPVRLDDPAVATDSEAQALLGIPDFSTRLPALLKDSPPDSPLLVVAPEDPWMSGDLVRLASIVLSPRPVIRWQRGAFGVSQRASAILFYKMDTPPALVARALPIGSHASLILAQP